MASAERGETRRKMVLGAARLLAERGLHETSFTQVLELTGAPRGSIYHHFPGGKEQLVGEAVIAVGSRAVQLIEDARGSTPVEVTSAFISSWRELLTRYDFAAGCSVAAVTVATDSDELLEHAATVFRTWRGRLAEALVSVGVAEPQAQRFAAVLISSAEGAVIVSRAERSIDSFDLVAGYLNEQASAL